MEGFMAYLKVVFQFSPGDNEKDHKNPQDSHSAGLESDMKQEC
jgi:hypothetical protein